MGIPICANMFLLWQLEEHQGQVAIGNWQQQHPLGKKGSCWCLTCLLYTKAILEHKIPICSTYHRCPIRQLITVEHHYVSKPARFFPYSLERGIQMLDKVCLIQNWETNTAQSSRCWAPKEWKHTKQTKLQKPKQPSFWDLCPFDGFCGRFDCFWGRFESLFVRAVLLNLCFEAQLFKVWSCFDLVRSKLTIFATN